MAKTFSASQRVSVIDTASPDNGKSGVVETCDAKALTCSVKIDGESAAKSFRYDQLDMDGKGKGVHTDVDDSGNPTRAKGPR